MFRICLTLALAIQLVFSLAVAPASAQNATSELPMVEADKRGAWLVSKENGGFLVIWYDERNKWDAHRILDYMLNSRGIQNVTALAGRTEGTSNTWLVRDLT